MNILYFMNAAIFLFHIQVPYAINTVLSNLVRNIYYALVTTNGKSLIHTHYETQKHNVCR